VTGLVSHWFRPLARSVALWNHRRLYRRRQSRRIEYATWCECYDTLSDEDSAALRARARPLPIDLLLADSEASLAMHQLLLQSLQAQWHAPWRLLVALGADASLAAWWQEQSASDERIVPVRRAADPLRTLLRRAAAPWCAVAQPGQRWRPHALLLLAEAVAQREGALLAYGDEDRLDTAGRRTAPWFKGDFDADALLAMNVLGAPVLWQRAALASRLGDEPLVESAAAHDLALRATRGLEAPQVVHVPHVLCHVAAAPAIDAAAAARAVQAHLGRCGVVALAQPDTAAPALVRVRFALPSPPPAVTIVIPTRNGLHLVRRCVHSILRRSTYPAYDLVIVDNGSNEPACLRWLDEIARDPRVTVRRDARPFNFAALNNAAVAQARGDFVALVNNDIELITPAWLEEMVSLAARPGVGAVGARLWFDDGSLQHAGVILGLGGSAGHVLKGAPRSEGGPGQRAWRLQTCLAVTAACLVVRKSTYESVGGMDENAFPVSFNDVDFCLKLSAAGYRNLWTPHAELFHLESVSRGKDHDAAKKRRLDAESAALRERWPEWIARDPYYNPNLTLRSEDCALAEPPRVSLRTPWLEGLAR